MEVRLHVERGREIQFKTKVELINTFYKFFSTFMHGTYGHYENYLILGRLCNVLRLNPSPYRLAFMHFGSMATQMGEGVREIGWVLDLALSCIYQGMQDASQMRTIQM